MKIPPKVKKAISICSYVLTGLFIAFIALVLYFNVTGKTFFVFDKALMWVKTNSMEPEIPAKSYIIVNKATGDDVKVGDVIVFHSDDPALHGELNTHRVVKIVNEGREFVTKGDNNPGEDKQTAKASNVIGIYRRRLPLLSVLGRFLSTSGGISVMALLILAVVILAFLPEILEYSKKSAKDKKVEAIIAEEIEKLKTEEQSKQTDENGEKQE